MKKCFLTLTIVSKSRSTNLIVLLLKLSIVKMSDIDKHPPETIDLISNAYTKIWLKSIAKPNPRQVTL